MNHKRFDIPQDVEEAEKLIKSLLKEISTDSRHPMWFADQAADHFQKELDSLELDLIRHKTFGREEEAKKVSDRIERITIWVKFLGCLTVILRDKSIKESVNDLFRMQK